MLPHTHLVLVIAFWVVVWAVLFAFLFLMPGCSVLTGPCTREVTVHTTCEANGTAVVLPDLR